MKGRFTGGTYIKYYDMRKGPLLRALPVTLVVVLSMCSDTALTLNFDDDLPHQAFGEHGMGLLTVSGVPGLSEKRRSILHLAYAFASLPSTVRAKYEHSLSSYSFGWSHGKECLQEGRPDLLKGSYYANPLHDTPCSDQNLIEKYPAFLHPNIWPTADLPALEPAFKDMGGLIVEVGALVARQCDSYVSRMCPAYPPNRLEKIVRESRVCKARLLHYFPIIPEGKGPDGAARGWEGTGEAWAGASEWCGWHNDHGSLTGLTSALYVDEEGEEVDFSDCFGKGVHGGLEKEEGGLFVLSRNGQVVKVNIPPDHLAFQIGETAQIHSGGLLKATPHAVKGTTLAKRRLSRETFAVFMEPEMDESMTMPAGRSREDVTQKIGDRIHEKGAHVHLPSLDSRWEPGMSFADFTAKTLASYY